MSESERVGCQHALSAHLFQTAQAHNKSDWHLYDLLEIQNLKKLFIRLVCRVGSAVSLFTTNYNNTGLYTLRTNSVFDLYNYLPILRGKREKKKERDAERCHIHKNYKLQFVK